MFSGGTYQTTFEWDQVPGADHYRIKYFLGGRVLFTDTTSSTSITLYSLEPEYYLFTVQTLCTTDQSIESGWTPLVKFTPSLNCVSPDGLTATPSVSSDFNIADLTWNDVPDALSYEVRYRPVGTADWIIKSSLSNNLRIEFLQAHTEYQWQLLSICSQDGQIGSSMITGPNFTTSNGSDCGVPGNPRSRVRHDLVLLRWNNVPESIEFEVLLREQGVQDWDTLTSDTFVVQVIGLQASTTYEWKVRSVCSIVPRFISAFTSIEIFTTGSNFAGARIASSSLELEPFSLVDATQHQVQVSPNPTNGMVNLTPTGFNTIQQINVLSLNGYLIKSLKSISGDIVELNLENLPPGMYFDQYHYRRRESDKQTHYSINPYWLTISIKSYFILK